MDTDLILNIMFYGLDVIILVMVIRMIRNTKKIELPIPLGFRWLMPGIFLVVALVGFFRYTGLFRWIQSGALIILGILYLFVGTGLAPEGIVAMGRLIPYEQAAPVKLNERDSCLYYMVDRRKATLYIAPVQVNEVRAYLQKRK